jgi:hypothetical protein
METSDGEAGLITRNQPSVDKVGFRVVFGSSLGTVFDWYDFFLYGSLAAIISKQFFAGVNETTGFIFAFPIRSNRKEEVRTVLRHREGGSDQGRRAVRERNGSSGSRRNCAYRPHDAGTNDGAVVRCSRDEGGAIQKRSAVVMRSETSSSRSWPPAILTREKLGYPSRLQMGRIERFDVSFGTRSGHNRSANEWHERLSGVYPRVRNRVW